MRTLLALCAVAAVLLPFEVSAGGCQMCTQASECGGGLCVQFTGNQGCGMNARICCPGQACALQADGGPSCAAAGTCTIVGSGGGAAGGGTAGGATVGGGTAGGQTGGGAAGGARVAGGTGGQTGGGTAGSNASAGGSVDGGVGSNPMTQGCGCSGGLAGPLLLGALLVLRRRRG